MAEIPQAEQFANWRKASASNLQGSTMCVEVGQGAKGVAVRDSKDRKGTPLTFGHKAWDVFITKIKQK